MAATFPDAIWDGDSLNRNSDDFRITAPDHRDWWQIQQEMTSVQDYILNSNILLNERYLYFGTTPEASLYYESSIVEMNLAESGTNDFRIGDGTNYVQFASNGAMTLVGTAKRKMTIRLDPDTFDLIAHSKPTQVEVGLFKGFSMPIYSSDNEEIFYQLRVPYRWDGISDPQICLLVALADAEDIDDKFKLQCTWESVEEEGILSALSHDVEVETTIVVAHVAQYTIYSVHFILDYDIHGAGSEVLPNDVMGLRIRRLAASASEVDNEIIVFNAIIEFNIDKVFGTWIRP